MCAKARTGSCCPRRKGISYGQGAVTVKEHRSALIIAPGLKVTTDDLKGPMAGFAETIERLKEDFIKPKSLKKTCLSSFTSSPCQQQGLWGEEVHITQGYRRARHVSVTPPPALSAYLRTSRQARKCFYWHHWSNNSFVCDRNTAVPSTVGI